MADNRRTHLEIFFSLYLAVGDGVHEGLADDAPDEGIRDEKISGAPEPSRCPSARCKKVVGRGERI